MILDQRSERACWPRFCNRSCFAKILSNFLQTLQVSLADGIPTEPNDHRPIKKAKGQEHGRGTEETKLTSF